MKPYVSVVIPARNEEESIAKCLSSVNVQSYPKDRFEVIVMDNGSEDETGSIAKSLGAKVINAEGLLIGAVRNAGAEASAGEILAFIDADCVAGPNWLESGVGMLNESGEIGAIGGRCSVPDDATWVQRAWGWKKSDLRTVTVDILSTGSFFVRKSTLLEVGGFNDQIMAGEDTEISRKIREHGKKLLLSSVVSVAHLGYPSSIKDFLSRQVWQSTDYLKSTKSKSDPVFLIVHLYLLLAFLGLISLPFENLKLLALSLFFGTVLLSLMLSVYRHLKHGRALNILLFLQYAILNYLYLLGRSIGLIISYFRIIEKKD